MASVEAVVRQIAAAPDRWRILERDVRRCLTTVFPYKDADLGDVTMALVDAFSRSER